MNTSVSILFYIKRAKANNLGVCPIYTRVTVNTKRFEFSTNKYINPDKPQDAATLEALVASGESVEELVLHQRNRSLVFSSQDLA